MHRSLVRRAGRVAIINEICVSCRFFVVANVIACAYSLVVLLVPTAPSPAARLVLVADAVSPS
jgi:hypothetical protein